MCLKKKNKVGCSEKVDYNSCQRQKQLIKKTIIFVSSKNGKLKTFFINGKSLQNHGDIHNSAEISCLAVCKNDHLYTGDSFGRVKRWVLDEKGKQLKLQIDYGCIQGDIINSIDTNIANLFISDSSGNFKQINQFNDKEMYDFGQIHDGEIMCVASNNEFAFSCDNLGNVCQIITNASFNVHEYQNVCTKGITTIAVVKNYLWVTNVEGCLRQINIDDYELERDEIKLHDNAIASICSNDYFVYTSDVTGIMRKFGASDRKIQHDFGVVCKGQILKMTIDDDYLVICSEEGEIKVFSLEDDKQLHKFNSGFGRSTSDIKISSFLL